MDGGNAPNGYGGGGGAAYAWPTEIGGPHNAIAGSGGHGVVVIRYRIE